jgi:hypothetical protein
VLTHEVVSAEETNQKPFQSNSPYQWPRWFLFLFLKKNHEIGIISKVRDNNEYGTELQAEKLKGSNATDCKSLGTIFFLLPLAHDFDLSQRGVLANARPRGITYRKKVCLSSILIVFTAYDTVKR